MLRENKLFLLYFQYLISIL